jgi:excisionase family DNA binding protein
MSTLGRSDGQQQGGVIRLLTIEEVAEYLQVPVQTLYHWRYKRTGPESVRVGRFVRYRRADVEAWLRTRTPASEQDEPARRRRKAS